MIPDDLIRAASYAVLSQGGKIKMCDLCDEKTRELALKGHAFRAEQLERMAAIERNIAARRIKPHTPEMSALKPAAEALIRYLVEDYL